MTTIAYHHKSKTVAYDSQKSAGGIITNLNHEKMLEFENGMRIIGSGDTHSIRELAKLYAGESSRLNGSIEYDALLLVISGSNVLRVGYDEGKGFWEEPVNFNIAIGSGGVLALAAMDFGRNAVGAVEYAKERDIHTGGKVKSISL